MNGVSGWLATTLLTATLGATPTAAWQVEAVAAGHNPESDTAADRAERAASFNGASSEEFVAGDYEYCLVCHGSRGQGNPALDAPVLAGMERWSLRNQLEAFREGWRGRHEDDLAGREMYPMATALAEGELNAVLDYIAALPPPSAHSPRSQHAVSRSAGHNPRAGSQVFSGCTSCHGRNAEGSMEMQGPALAYQDPGYLQRQLMHFRDGIRGSAEGDLRGADMAQAVRELSDAQIRDVVSYISTLRN